MGTGPARAPISDPGLCAQCAHATRLVTPRSVFWLCRAARNDPRLVKYPRLPVHACHAYAAGLPDHSEHEPPSKD